MESDSSLKFCFKFLNPLLYWNFVILYLPNIQIKCSLTRPWKT